MIDTIDRLFSGNDDDDEPYSPEDDEPYSPSALDDTPSTKPSTDLEREMEEIDRKIAEEKQKLQQFVSIIQSFYWWGSLTTDWLKIKVPQKPGWCTFCDIILRDKVAIQLLFINELILSLFITCFMLDFQIR